jgi:hypothetical protein
MYVKWSPFAVKSEPFPVTSNVAAPPLEKLPEESTEASNAGVAHLRTESERTVAGCNDPGADPKRHAMLLPLARKKDPVTVTSVPPSTAPKAGEIKDT